MASFLFEGAYTRLASLTADDYSDLRVLLVETAPTVTDEFVTDLDETAAANYARKTPTGGTILQQGQKTTVSGSIPTWSALGTAETLTHWVLVYNTGSDATSWLVAAAALNHTCDGGDLTISTGGFLIDPTITRALGGGTAAEVSYDDTGNTAVTGDTVQAALDTIDSGVTYIAGEVSGLSGSVTDLTTFLRIMAETATGGAVTLPTDRSLIAYDLDPGDNPWVITVPDLTGETESIVYHVALLAQVGGNVAVSFASDGGAQDIVYSGPAPSEIPEEGLMLLTITAQAGALGKVYIDWASNVDGWGLTGHSATVTGGTHLFSHAFEHITLTGTDPTLARDLRDCGGGSGMFWLLLTNSSGSSRTITWGPTMTWVAGGSLTSLANGATALVMLQTLDSGATAKAVNVTGLASSGSVATDTIFDAKGDLAVGTGSDTAAKLTVGSNDDFLVADSGQTTGLKWAGGSTARTALGVGTAGTLASDTDGTLAANSDSNIATQKATKTYADTKIPKSTVTAKGDLIVATGSGAVSNLAVSGTAGLALVPDTSASGGLAWGSPGAMRNRYLRPTGALAESIERTVVSPTGFSANAGRVYAVAVVLPRQTTVTSITFVSVGALSVGSNQWFGLYDSAGNQLRITNDDTSTAWGANTAKTLNLSSTYTTGNSDGLYYLVAMQNATTPATLAQSTITTSTASGVAALSPVLGGRDNGTGYTNPASAPSTLNLNANIGTCLYAYCS